MDGTNPKVSFIPKGSLVREESFLSRPRPRSVMGIVAVIAFVASVGSYAGLYYYNNSLNQVIAEETTAITNAQKEFSDAPEVGEAKIFRARADLALKLLNAHTTVSPVFAFLSKNTTESILYDKFDYKNDLKGPTVELSGEAPNYAALAFQTDVLKTKTEELSSFSVGNITLTKFGTVTFTLSFAFNPGYLLYTKNLSNPDEPSGQPKNETIVVPSVPSPSVATGTTASKKLIDFSRTGAQATSTSEPAIGANSISSDGTVAPATNTPGGVVQGTEAKQSILMMLWSKFKFW